MNAHCFWRFDMELENKIIFCVSKVLNLIIPFFTMSTPKSELRESLECSICVNLFDEPKQLSCGHTFCLQCVRKITKREPGFQYIEVIRCPFCQKITNIPSEGLRTNYVIKGCTSYSIVSPL